MWTRILSLTSLLGLALGDWVEMGEGEGRRMEASED